MMKCVHSITIDSNDATIRLVRRLSYAQVQSLVYVILARDGANATTTATLTINVLDSQAQGPRFKLDQYSATVKELNNTLEPVIIIHVSSYNRCLTNVGARETGWIESIAIADF